MGGTTEKMVDNSSAYLDELRRAVEAIGEAWQGTINQILEAQRAMQEYLALAAVARQAGGSGGGANGGGTNPNTGNNGNNNGGNSGNQKGQYIDRFVRTETSPTANGK